MSKQIIKNYAFSVSAKTITLGDFGAGQPVLLERLALITDVTTNQILYNFADGTGATASVSSNNVITLSALPGGVADTDKLRIDYNTVTNDPTYDAAATANSTKITDGTNTVNVLKADGTAAGQNGQMIAPTYQVQTFSFSGVGTGTVYDVSNYRSVSVQISSLYSGTTPTVLFQVSNDGTNWSNNSLIPSSQTAGSSAVTGGTSINVLHGPLAGRYFRLSMTGTYASGTTTGTIFFSTLPTSPFSAQVNNPATTISAALPAGTNAIGTVGSSTATGSAYPANAFFMGAQDTTNLVGLKTTSVGDGQATGILAAGTMLYNNSSNDRMRGNIAVSTLASAARTTTTAGSDTTNHNGRGVRCVLNVTVASGTGGLQLQVQGKDFISGSYYALNTTPTAVTATGTYVYDVYQGSNGTATGGITQKTDALVPRTFRVNVVHGDSSSYTYSVSTEVLL